MGEVDLLAAKQLLQLNSYISNYYLRAKIHLFHCLLFNNWINSSARTELIFFANECRSAKSFGTSGLSFIVGSSAFLSSLVNSRLIVVLSRIIDSEKGAKFERKVLKFAARAQRRACPHCSRRLLKKFKIN